MTLTVNTYLSILLQIGPEKIPKYFFLYFLNNDQHGFIVSPSDHCKFLDPFLFLFEKT